MVLVLRSIGKCRQLQKKVRLFKSSGEAKPIQIRGMRGRPLQVQCGRFHTLTICGEQEMTEHEFDALERMLEDRLGIREAEGKATMERYRTTTGKKRRRRRQVNRLGQEEYVSETETEQSELDLAPEIEDQIVLESDMYLEKMEECEELKEKMEEMEGTQKRYFQTSIWSFDSFSVIPSV